MKSRDRREPSALDLLRIARLRQEAWALKQEGSSFATENSALFVLYLTVSNTPTLCAWKELQASGHLHVAVEYEKHLARLVEEGFLWLDGESYRPLPIVWITLKGLYEEETYLQTEHGLASSLGDLSLIAGDDF